MKNVHNSSGFSRLHAERDDVLDLEIDCAADPDAVAQSLFAYLDGDSLCPQILSYERAKRLHRATEFALKTPGE